MFPQLKSQGQGEGEGEEVVIGEAEEETPGDVTGNSGRSRGGSACMISSILITSFAFVMAVTTRYYGTFGTLANIR